MTRTSQTAFQIQWMNFNGDWRATPGPIYPTRVAAQKVIRQLGLAGNPAYRIVEA